LHKGAFIYTDTAKLNVIAQIVAMRLTQILKFCCLLLMAMVTLQFQLSAQDKTNGNKKKNAPKKPIPFQKNLQFNALSFSIQSPGLDSANTITIVPKGLKLNNNTVSLSLGATVHDVLFGDIDSDSWPELIVWENAVGKAPSIIHGFTVNNGLTLTPFNTEWLNKQNELTEGMQGNDEYQIGNNILMYRFPLFKGSKKTGKTRQLQFSLLTTDDAKQLWFDKNIDY
jgi:hypothetical protein